VKREVKLAVWERDRWRCRYCGVPLHDPAIRERTNGKTRPATVDHVVPRSNGGSNHFRNLVSACRSCNGRKGSFVTVKPPPIPPAVAAFVVQPRVLPA
jgi:5-methylcytosine-specific restriction endonuclease McrA